MSPLQVFVSYSHKDESYLSELEKHLTTLKREKLISTWHDRKIVPGQEWEKAIGGALQESDIYVFLISPDFVASEYCIEKEVSIALERHNSGRAIVIPIVVRPVDWLSTPLGRIQALPKDANPISTWGDKDQAWLEVIKGIRISISAVVRHKDVALGEQKVFGIQSSLTTFVELLEQRYSSDVPTIGGVATGLHDLDLLIDGIHQGDLIYVASSPVMDRFAFLVSVTNHAVVEKHQSGIIFSLRQSHDQVARRLSAAIGKIPVHSLQRGEMEDDDWASLTFALGMLNDANLLIVEGQTIDIDSLTAQIASLKDKVGGNPLVFIDNLELVTGGSKTKLLSVLGRYARKNRISIIVTDGLATDPAVRPNKRPVMRDIGEWVELNEDIDIVILVYQEEKYYPDSPDRGLVELMVAKNQRGGLGIIEVVQNRGQGLENFKRTSY